MMMPNWKPHCAARQQHAWLSALGFHQCHPPTHPHDRQPHGPRGTPGLFVCLRPAPFQTNRKEAQVLTADHFPTVARWSGTARHDSPHATSGDAHDDEPGATMISSEAEI